ncbi:hypothetical protein [Ideonella alba]|uniref:Uncharacterized protein n=1 Tax=Ideonella alba TaxID=2824118 RepID=A0A941BDH4_9BURK|nr:hypothetical protein [Ideonella alba]MBQ0930211.1 hypothetical protein [Ideonella alba]
MSLRHWLSAAALVLSALPASAAVNCPSLATGDYRVINFRETDPNWRHHVLHLDGDTLTVTLWNGETATLTPQAESCAYMTPDMEPMMVSRSGVFIIRSPLGMAIGLPEMTLPRKALVGTYNMIGASMGDDGLFHTDSGQVQVDSKGQLRLSTCGDGGIGACGAPGSVFGQLVANTGGGYDLQFTDGGVDRVFTFKNKNGAVHVVVSLNQLHVLTPAVARSLPAVGSRDANWSFSQSANGQLSGVNFEHRRVLSADAATQSFVRRANENCVKQTMLVNLGHDGVVGRAAGSGKNCSGQTVNFNAVAGLPTGLGLTVFGWESSDPTMPRYFGLAVEQP